MIAARFRICRSRSTIGTIIYGFQQSRSASPAFRYAPDECRRREFQAGCARRTGNQRNNRSSSGAFFGRRLPESAGDRIRFCTITWRRCTTRIGKLATLLHRREVQSAHPSGAQRSGEVFAAATASWTARFTPTPATGDIACAASPMHRSPGRCQVRNRSILTVRSLTLSAETIVLLTCSLLFYPAQNCFYNIACRSLNRLACHL